MFARFAPKALALLLPLGVALTLAPPTPAPAPPPDIKPGKYAVDSGHSCVVFGIRHLGVSNFYGRFNSLGGEFTLDLEEPSESNILLVIDPASVDTNSANRDGHVRSPDFLDTEEFKELTFRSTKVEKGDRDTLKVTGDMTMHGETKSITVDVDLVGGGDTAFGDYRSGVEARFKLKRSEFGMRSMLDKLGDEIDILVSLEGILQS